MDLTINKIAAGVVGLAMVAGLALAFTATRAHASELSDLVAVFIAMGIISDEDAEAALAAVEAMEGEEASSMACEFTRNLTTGDTGADVMDLQKLLNANDFTVSVAGAGSPGMETEYYGPATAGAVAKMQEAFAADILTPLGLTAGTGYFGASTRAKANELCGDEDMPGVPSLPGDEDDEDMDDEDLDGGEATYGSLSRSSSPSSVEVSEGDEEVEVAGFEFDVDDADSSLRRVYVSFQEDGTAASDDPWDYFEAVQIYVNGDMVDEMAADDEDDWEDISGSTRYEMRFTGLDEFLPADEEVEITFGVTMLNNVDSSDEVAEWNVMIPEDGVRVRDGQKIDSKFPSSDSTARKFTLEAAGQDEELKIKSDSSNPDASIIKVDTSSETDDAVILVFGLEAEETDVEIREFPIIFTTNDNDIDDVISDVIFEVDGESMGDISSAGVGTTTTFEFDNNDFIIDEGDTVQVKIIVDIKDTSDYAEGTYLSVDVTSTERDAIVAEGTNDFGNSDKSGTAIGETHQLLSEGVFAEIVSIDETSKSDGSNDDAVGEFEFKFDLTAFDDTFYVSATSSAVIGYTVYDADGASTTVKAMSSTALSSTATKEGTTAYRVDEDDTETFTFTVSFDAPVQGFYSVTLDSVTYGTSAALPYGSSHTAAPAEDFESGDLNLNV